MTGVHSRDDRDDFCYAHDVTRSPRALEMVAHVHGDTDLGRDVQLACDAAETAIADTLLLTLELGDRRPCHGAAAEGR